MRAAIFELLLSRPLAWKEHLRNSSLPVADNYLGSIFQGSKYFKALERSLTVYLVEPLRLTCLDILQFYMVLELTETGENLNHSICQDVINFRTDVLRKQRLADVFLPIWFKGNDSVLMELQGLP